MGWQWGMHGQEGRWRGQAPGFKDISKVGNRLHQGDTCRRCCSCECSSNNLKAMDYLILCGQGRDREVGMAKFDHIGDNLTLGVCIDQFEAAV
jgi:hypothetical protein